MSISLVKPFTITQGGADTAAETSLSTLIQPGITFDAWLLSSIEFTLKPDLVKTWAAADSDLTIQLTKRSLSGSIARIVTYTDTDLLASWSLAGINSGTAANMLWIPTTFVLNFMPGVYVYSEYLYLHLISAATGATNVAWGRIFYDLVKLTKDEAFAIIASRP